MSGCTELSGSAVSPEVYSYSADEEIFRGEFSTREAALEEARDGQNDMTVWTGVCEAIHVRRYMPDGDDLIERMVEQAYDDCGEASESWLDSVSKEQRAELTEGVRSLIEAWLDKHKLNANFWNVVNIIEHAPVANATTASQATPPLGFSSCYGP